MGLFFFSRRPRVHFEPECALIASERGTKKMQTPAFWIRGGSFISFGELMLAAQRSLKLNTCPPGSTMQIPTRPPSETVTSRFPPPMRLTPDTLTWVCGTLQ
jgi:hypothetical protein